MAAEEPEFTMPEKGLDDMDTVEFFKFLVVQLVDVAKWPFQGRVVQRLVNITRAMEAEALPAEPNLVKGPDAANPNEDSLREKMVDIVRQAYIGHTGSRVKANKVVGNLLEVLEEYYMKAERDGMGGVVN